MFMPHALVFASDATLTAIAGGGLLLIALLAAMAERRRARRKHIDAVGWAPWTALFLLAFIAGVVLLGVAVQGWGSG